MPSTFVKKTAGNGTWKRNKRPSLGQSRMPSTSHGTNGLGLLLNKNTWHDYALFV